MNSEGTAMVIIVNQLLDAMRLRKELSSQEEIATDIRLLTLLQTNNSVFPPRRTVWSLAGGWWLVAAGRTQYHEERWLLLLLGSTND